MSGVLKIEKKNNTNFYTNWQLKLVLIKFYLSLTANVKTLRVIYNI